MERAAGSAPPSRRLPRVLRVSIVIATLLLLTVLALHHHRNQHSQVLAAAGPVYVTTTEVRPTVIQVSKSALGTVTPLVTATVGSRVDGQILSVHFHEGQVVTKGQLLAEIDPRPYQATLDQLDGQLQKDQALLNSAMQDLERYKSLAAHHSIPQQQLDQQSWLVKQYEGTVKSDNGAIASARVNIAYCSILAPITGRAGLRSVDPGNIVHAASSSGIVTITQNSPISIIFNLPEQELSGVLAAERDQTLQVEAWDRDDSARLATGTVSAIDNLVDTTAGTIRVRALFSNTSAHLFPNQFVNIHLNRSGQKAIAVPSASLQRDGDSAYVFVVGADQRARRRTVQVAYVRDEQAVLSGGVTAGERVLLQGFDRVQDGTIVQPMEAGR